MIRIGIIDDNEFYRYGIQLILNTNDQFVCNECFSSCEEALKKSSFKDLDILLLDIELQGMNGYEAIPLIKRKNPNIDVIMLSSSGNETYIIDSLKNGACSYISKSIPPSDLIDNIIIVFQGGSVMSPDIARKISIYFQNNNTDSPLTSRESEILNLAGEIKSNSQIAKKLNLSVETIRAHFKHIYLKLDVHSKTEAYSKAVKNKWI